MRLHMNIGVACCKIYMDVVFLAYTEHYKLFRVMGERVPTRDGTKSRSRTYYQIIDKLLQGHSVPHRED